MCNHHHHHHNNKKTNMLPKISISLLLLIIGIFCQYETIKIILYLSAYLISALNILTTALKNIKKGDMFDENFLMSAATLGAFVIKEYPEAIMVIILYQIGEYLQDKAVAKSKKSISELMDIRPDYANIEKNGRVIKENPDKVKLNDIIIVKAGEKIPLDGIIIDGQGTIDTSAITGESVPRKVITDDCAISGCVNTNGVLKIRVTKEFHDSTVNKILELVEHAGSKKANTEKFITKFAKIYTPIVVLGAILLAFVPPFLIGADFNLWLHRALTFLVISCPCALVISVPLAFFAGIGKASADGILIKGSKYIELLANPETIAFDKTGTLTCGTFSVQKICPNEGISKDELLQNAAIIETYSNHPIAISIKNACSYKFDKNNIKDAEEYAGKGLKVRYGSDILIAGNIELMKQFNVNAGKINEAGSIIYIAKNAQYLGYITISDKQKPSALTAIKKLKALNIQTIMLSGDTKNNAETIGRELAIDKVYSALLPADKVQITEELISRKPGNKSIVFVGDGINDAPVLTTADIGIAMGALGSDAAIEASDIVIMDDNLSKIPLAINIARKTMQIAKQNIIFAIGIKIIFLILGTIGIMTLWGAVFADVGVTLLAVLNSLRILQFRG